ncbi:MULTISPECIES: ParB N-terminal domain-containing protein [Elizabethkingia]|uniref:ParB N-terminal domain-containing protein n=1 Tax=Elizabethkingia TaxID=308865 RepID=UPI0021A6C070|nr:MULTISPECIES: ParB N-terminal domain-containing protein [Elizabethkingia]MCT3669704.1 DNA methylase [Elizabethkingia anophelis]MCT3689567.1 DNA methylase [Elizabethkingia anophelis]MCT3706345.1 DNA methylase [Elizabethkingia anophelis]MCT3713363.1 DNA methylase [Elizabethkingia anophelis]MCT3716781.1 DNA methylase [Elizabethkingia anophelis]
MSTNKVKQSETRTILRSSFSFSDYNPRTISDDARKKLKANIKKNGIIGGLVVNEQTGNLVSGHQRVSIADEVNKYDSESGKNDYEIKVEIIDVDLKTEKELNIFFNSKSVQGEMDYAKLALMIPDIDIDIAGLDDVDMSFIEMEMPEPVEVDVPTFEPQASKKEKSITQELDNSVSTPEASISEREELEEKSRQEKIDAVKKVKESVKENSIYEGDPYFTVSFDSYENKVFFLEQFGISADVKIIKGEELAEKINNM